mmetsp:Transcript_1371/g.4131  ORF Transcript_1371/g.4131 Transcript_1371/m.4131 type:complete len:298 (+) Transcript_1371:708-1601(+)
MPDVHAVSYASREFSIGRRSERSLVEWKPRCATRWTRSSRGISCATVSRSHASSLARRPSIPASCSRCASDSLRAIRCPSASSPKACVGAASSLGGSGRVASRSGVSTGSSTPPSTDELTRRPTYDSVASETASRAPGRYETHRTHAAGVARACTAAGRWSLWSSAWKRPSSLTSPSACCSCFASASRSSSKGEPSEQTADASTDAYRCGRRRTDWLEARRALAPEGSEPGGADSGVVASIPTLPSPALPTPALLARFLSDFFTSLRSASQLATARVRTSSYEATRRWAASAPKRVT